MQTISIIIPVYNRAHIVERTLGSVLAQSHRPLQVVLVDNDSSDDSLAVLQGFAQENNTDDFQVKVVTESHHTAGAARNRGAKEATGEWLMFFDSDDEMHPALVADYLAAIEQAGGDVDIVSTGATLRFPDGTTRALPFHMSDIMAVQMLHSQLATQRYAVRKAFFEKCGEWNPDLPVWNDWELGVRLLLADPRMAYMGNERVFVNHSGEASITGNSFSAKAGQWEHVMDVVEEELSASSHPEATRLKRLLEFKRVTLAAQYQREGLQEQSQELCKGAYSRLCDSYSNSLKWRVIVAPIVRKLFARIVNGKRGSAIIARKLL